MYLLKVMILKNISTFSFGSKKFSLVFDKLKPDAILILGDRYEIFASAISACFNKTTIIHLHGGERTEGSIDESIRLPKCKKMSHLHFVSTDEYKKESHSLVKVKVRINVGSLGVEAIKKIKIIDKDTQKNLKSNFKDKIALCLSDHLGNILKK